jgi:hypothetical protein
MLAHPTSPARGRRARAACVSVLVLLAGSPVAAALAEEPGSPGLARPPRVQPAVEDVPFVYFRDDRTTTMAGSDRDAARARRHRRADEPMLWFRRDGREYVVRDPGVLRDVDELWEPVERIGAEQGRLGARQGTLGAEQGRYGARQGEVGARQGLIGARQGLVGARLGLLAARGSEGVSAAERRAIARERETLEREMRELGRQQQELDEEMREVSPPPREHEEEMEALGRRMAVLGRRMDGAVRDAQAGMRRLVDRAIRDGAARLVR